MPDYIEVDRAPLGNVDVPRAFVEKDGYVKVATQAVSAEYVRWLSRELGGDGKFKVEKILKTVGRIKVQFFLIFNGLEKGFDAFCFEKAE